MEKETGEEKPTIQSFARKFDNDDNKTYYESTFEITEGFGEIGGVLIENEHHREMFVKSIVLDGSPSGPININCDSWIHPKSDNPEKRVFFSNKVRY